jgi:DNA-binding transcriptional regulator YiaG
VIGWVADRVAESFCIPSLGSEYANIRAMKGTSPQLIGEIRRRSGLRPAELARRAGLPRSVVSAYEHGRRQPGVDALARLA